MQTRFYCPACKSHHVLDMPETTIHMTCGRTGKHLRLNLGVGGEPIVTVLDDDGSDMEPADEADATH